MTDPVDRCLAQGERWFLDEMGLLWFRCRAEKYVPRLFDCFQEGSGAVHPLRRRVSRIPMMEEIDHAKARAVLTMYYHDYLAEQRKAKP